MNERVIQPLSGRVVAVTGASRGIGESVVARLLDAGAVVIAGSRTARPGSSDRLHRVELDVSSPDSVQAFAEAAISFGVDSVVSNAGVGSFANIESFDVSEYRRIFDTNVLGTLLVCRSLVPHFRVRHDAGETSQAIIVTSDVSSRTWATGALYSGSKFAQRAIARTLAQEGQEFSLRVTEIRPGMTDTYFNGRSPGTPERESHLRPEDVADAILFALGVAPHVRIDEITMHPVTQTVDF